MTDKDIVLDTAAPSSIGPLSALSKKPRAIGVGYSQAAIATIYPLSHDIPMDVIVTEEAVVERQLKRDVRPAIARGKDLPYPPVANDSSGLCS